MENTKLENSITYGETQVKYLQDEIDNEIRYQRRIKREKTENKKNFNKYFNVIWALSFVIFSFTSIIMMFVEQSRKAHEGPNGEWVEVDEFTDAFAAIAGILLGPFIIFSIIGLIKYVPKFINHLKQLKGTEDPRSRGYKTYDDLMAISEGRMKYLQEELTQTIVKLEADKLALEEVRRIGEGEGQVETIEMDELFALKQEAEKEKEEPLLIEEEYQKDIGVTASRKEAGDKTGKSRRK